MTAPVHTEARDGFEIALYLLEEDTAIADSFDDHPSEIRRMEDEVDRGVMLWFCAKVAASRGGVELGADYLGACMYACADDFRLGGHYDDMVGEAIARARETLGKITPALDVAPAADPAEVARLESEIAAAQAVIDEDDAQPSQLHMMNGYERDGAELRLCRAQLTLANLKLAAHGIA